MGYNTGMNKHHPVRWSRLGVAMWAGLVLLAWQAGGAQRPAAPSLAESAPAPGAASAPVTQPDLTLTIWHINDVHGQTDRYPLLASLLGRVRPADPNRLDLLVHAGDEFSKGDELNRQIQERFAEILPFIPLMSPGGSFAYRSADYGGWVYTMGTGIMTAWSFLPVDAAK